MNRRLLSDMKGDVWNEKEIDRRSRVIANYVKEIWPHADALRQELGIVARDDHGEDLDAGIPAEMAERIIESVTETGIEEDWADTEGLLRSRRQGRYGRHLNLGGGSQWQGYWLGVSPSSRDFVLESWEPREYANHPVDLPDERDFDDVLESITTQVRDIADSIASTGGSATG